MNYLRKLDKTGHDLADIQARMFSKSAEQNIPSYFFIKIFSYYKEVNKMDDLSFLYGNVSEEDIYFYVKSKIKKHIKGTVYSKAEMHWIGYFYRSFSYVTGWNSKKMFETIPPKYLLEVYQPYHTQDIMKSIQMVIDDLNIKDDNQEERIFTILKMTM